MLSLSKHPGPLEEIRGPFDKLRLPYVKAFR